MMHAKMTHPFFSIKDYDRQARHTGPVSVNDTGERPKGRLQRLVIDRERYSAEVQRRRNVRASANSTQGGSKPCRLVARFVVAPVDTVITSMAMLRPRGSEDVACVTVLETMKPDSLRTGRRFQQQWLSVSSTTRA